jgi:hypothetical protein
MKEDKVAAAILAAAMYRQSGQQVKDAPSAGAQIKTYYMVALAIVSDKK